MGVYRALETPAATPRAGGTYRNLDTAAAPAAPAPRKASVSDEISGALSTLYRAIPLADEASDGLSMKMSTMSDMLTGADKVKPGEHVDDYVQRLEAKNWKRARDWSKASADDFLARHPVVANLTKGAGLAATMIPAFFTGGTTAAPQVVADIAPAASRGLMGAVQRLAPKITKGAVTGGLMANLTGLADEGTLAERIDEGAAATPMGAAFGAALPPAAEVAGAVARAGRRTMIPAAQRATATAGRILAGRAPLAVETAPAAPDGLLPFERMGGGGRSLARAVAAVPGPGKDIAERVLATRQAEAPGRMLRSTTMNLGDDGSAFHPTLDALDAQRLTESNPLFEAAFAKPPVVSSRLDDMARRPSVRDAMRRAFKLAQEEGEDPRALGLFHMEDPVGWASEAPPTERVVAEAEKVAAKGGRSRESRGPSLVKFIADGGGLKDTGGDVAAMDGAQWHKGRAFQSKLMGPGADADTWALRAWEKGYFPQHSTRPTVNDLLDTLGEELRGRPRFARQADPRAVDRNIMRGQADEIAYRGGHADDLPNADDYGGRPEPQTDPVFGEAMTPKSWHYVKRGLDDLIESKRDPVTGKLPRTDEMRLYDQTRRALRSELTKQNPEYGVALKAYAGPSRQIDAMHLGRRLATGKIDPEDIQARGERMSTDELDALRLGVSRGLSDLFRSGNPQAAFRRFATDGVAQGRLRAAFRDDEAYGRFIGDIEHEVRAQKSHNDILAGSRTTPLREDIDAANAAAAGNPVIEAAMRRVGGQSFKSQAAQALLENWHRVRQPGLNNPEVSRMLGEALFESGDPHRLLDALIQEKAISPAEVRAVLPMLEAGAGEISANRQRGSR